MQINKNYILAVGNVISKKEMRKFLHYIQFTIDGDKLHLDGTGGNRLHRVSLPISDDDQLLFEAYKTFCKTDKFYLHFEHLKVVKSSVGVVLQLNENFGLELILSGVKCPLVSDVAYPDVNRILPDVNQEVMGFEAGMLNVQFMKDAADCLTLFMNASANVNPLQFMPLTRDIRNDSRYWHHMVCEKTGASMTQVIIGMRVTGQIKGFISCLDSK